MIGRIAWWALIAAIAVVTIGVQLDRGSEFNPALAENVPPPARSAAQARIAERALASGEADALAEARRLVRRRPVPAEHLTTLARAQLEAGRPLEAAVTIQYAAQRGWRDPLAQEAMLQLALEAGDLEQAARRYAALFLRDSTSDAVLERYGGPVLGALRGDRNEAARGIFSSIIGQADRYHDRFVRRGAAVLPPDAFAHAFAQVAQDGGSFDCRTVRNAIRLLERSDPASTAPLGDYVTREC